VVPLVNRVVDRAQSATQLNIPVTLSADKAVATSAINSVQP
jgi:hypothetical protein